MMRMVRYDRIAGGIAEAQKIMPLHTGRAALKM
jgi:hypothetical protein